MYERILVCLDGLPHAESVLPDAVKVATNFGAEVLLLRVVPRAVPPSEPAEHEAQLAEAARYLDEVAERLRAGGLKVRVLVREGTPARTIMEAARDADVGLIAMATHGRRGVVRSVLGSVAEEVLRESHLPLLLVNPKE